jgi:hypothetical protein
MRRTVKHDRLGRRNSRPNCGGGAGQAASSAMVAISRARSCGRDRRWSPSLISVTRTSFPVRRPARTRLVSQGTSGSRCPCSSRTGPGNGIGACSSVWRSPSSISRRVIGIGSP